MTVTPLLVFFCAAAVAGGALMLVLRHPMHVALSLIATMLALAAIYALLAVHVIAVFQVLIYVGAVMVFMVYAIMLLDVRDRSFTSRYSGMLLPGMAAGVVLAVVLIAATATAVAPTAAPEGDFGVQAFSAAFLSGYWFYFELTTILLLAAVVAAIAVLKGRGRGDG